MMKKLLLVFLMSFLSLCEVEAKAILQAVLEATSCLQSQRISRKVEVGSLVEISATVENVGDQPNKEGFLFVRYAFQKELRERPNSTLYESERVELPSLQPGEKALITFVKLHKWPNLIDFMRQDWGSRHYEAIADIDETKTLIGILGITFSAYYYTPPAVELPSEVPQAID